MRAVNRVVASIVVLAVLGVAGLAIFIRFYFTDERVRQVAVPQLEKALGRKVLLGPISAGLFSGIQVGSLAIREADGKEDFVTAGRFRLKYALLPLLQKKLLIHEILLDRPQIHIRRRADGTFNYQDLAILHPAAQQEGTPATPQATASPAAPLPFALTIQQVRVRNGLLTFTDEQERLPDSSTAFSLDLSLALGRQPGQIDYNGSLELTTDIGKQGQQGRIAGTVRFSPAELGTDLDCTLGGQQFHLTGKASGFQQAPTVTLEISSKQLEVDKLLAAATVLAGDREGEAAATPAGATQEKDTARPIAAALPADLTASGRLAVDKAVFRGVEMRALILRFRLAKGIFTVEELGAVAMGGSLAGALQADLNRPEPPWSGNLELRSLQADQLQNALARTARALVQGTLEGAVRFAGAGFEPAAVKQSLSAEGRFALRDGRLQETPLTRAIASLVGLGELRSLAFRKMDGTFQLVRGGRVRINTTIDAPILEAAAAGDIGLDGTLDLPLTLTLPPATASRLGSASRFLTDSQGNAVLNLRLAGTLARPRPTLDRRAVGRQVQRAVQRSVLDRLAGRTAGGTAGGTTSGTTSGSRNTAPSGLPAAGGLLKNLFGR